MFTQKVACEGMSKLESLLYILGEMKRWIPKLSLPFSTALSANWS